MTELSDLLQSVNSGRLSARAIARAAQERGYTLNHDTAARYLRGDHGMPDEATLVALAEVSACRSNACAPRPACRRAHHAVHASGGSQPPQPAPAAGRGRDHPRDARAGVGRCREACGPARTRREAPLTHRS